MIQKMTRRGEMGPGRQDLSRFDQIRGRNLWEIKHQYSVEVPCHPQSPPRTPEIPKLAAMTPGPAGDACGPTCIQGGILSGVCHRLCGRMRSFGEGINLPLSRAAV
jgi:hypothetical protein